MHVLCAALSCGNEEVPAAMEEVKGSMVSLVS